MPTMTTARPSSSRARASGPRHRRLCDRPALRAPPSVQCVRVMSGFAALLSSAAAAACQMPRRGRKRDEAAAMAAASHPVAGPAIGTREMPTIFRFLVTLVILLRRLAARVFYLAYFVDPRPREMTVSVPADKLQPKVAARRPSPTGTRVTGGGQGPASGSGCRSRRRERRRREAGGRPAPAAVISSKPSSK